LYFIGTPFLSFLETLSRFHFLITIWTLAIGEYFSLIKQV
jgi:hypothetical protein